ncbi:MAG: hypothetical protein ABJE80_12775 [Reichenbachiella sp.]|uniref:hypothetical protein n=1 Tax=Reichenbachiella sp. TaxID=2184521 RepID=UPI0032640A17
MQGKTRKCVFVIGPESSGSMLIAKICSHVLGIQAYGSWDGAGWSDEGHHKVCHRSLPYSNPPVFPDIDAWISTNKDEYNIHFVLTTRDLMISEISRFDRFAKPLRQSKLESEKAKEIMKGVMNKDQKYLIWSYETFLFLGLDYLQLLYQFLDVKSDFIPDLVDGNRSKIVKIGFGRKVRHFLRRIYKLIS